LFATTAFMLWQLMPPADSSGFSNRRLLRFSLPISLNRLLLYSNNQTEVLFLGFIDSAATTGIFGVARRAVAAGGERPAHVVLDPVRPVGRRPAPRREVIHSAFARLRGRRSSDTAPTASGR